MSSPLQNRPDYGESDAALPRGIEAGGSVTMYHIGPRPAEPKPYRHVGEFGTSWERPGREKVFVGCFLSTNYCGIHLKHQISGHVYAYDVPRWVIKESGGLRIVSQVNELLVPEDLWPHVKFKGKVIDRSELDQECLSYEKGDRIRFRHNQRKHKTPPIREGATVYWRDPNQLHLKEPFILVQLWGNKATIRQTKPGWGGRYHEYETTLNRLYTVASPSKVAARYKKKREVPKAEGNGTTTVYEYSDRQVQNRNREKAKRIEKLRGSIKDLRTQVHKDLNAEDTHTRLTALAIALMDETYERVGNAKSAEENDHFGVTTWKAKHITLGKGKATIKYVGKSGVKQTKEVVASKTLAALKKALKGKDAEEGLLCEGDDCVVLAEDVNAYLKPYSVTAKDIRGLHANEEMRSRLKAVRSKGGKLPADKKDREKKLKAEFTQALEETAKVVGHEVSTLKSQYLVPGLEDAFLADGSVVEKLDKKALRVPLVQGVRYSVKSSTNGVAVSIYEGRNKIGGMNAFISFGYDACEEDVFKLAAKYPQVETGRWIDSQGKERLHLRTLQVHKAFITDESKQGMGIGKSMCRALMAEWFDKNGPFLFMPMSCGGASGTSRVAQRVWVSLTRDFPSSGTVVAVLRRPTTKVANRDEEAKMGFTLEWQVRAANVMRRWLGRNT